MDDAANDSVNWEPLFKEDGVFLRWVGSDGEKLLNLGPESLVLGKWADIMAQRDFGE